MASLISKLRDIVWTRCKGYCEKCGLPLGDDWALHHRKLKSRGGKDEASNLVALHHACHNTGTHSVHLNPAKAEKIGLMVRSWQEPAECQLTLPDGSIVTLTSDGMYQFIERKTNDW